MPGNKDVPSSVMVDGIKFRKEGHHDTIYCNESQASALTREVRTPGLHSSNIDNLRFMELDVQVLPIEKPIVCQKGEVFDLAKDYKNGSV